MPFFVSIRYTEAFFHDYLEAVFSLIYEVSFLINIFRHFLHRYMKSFSVGQFWMNIFRQFLHRYIIKSNFSHEYIIIFRQFLHQYMKSFFSWIYSGSKFASIYFNFSWSVFELIYSGSLHEYSEAVFTSIYRCNFCVNTVYTGSQLYRYMKSASEWMNEYIQTVYMNMRSLISHKYTDE